MSISPNEKRFDQLMVGDRINWTGADDDSATVTEVLSNDETVWIAWETSGNRHAASLRWRPNDRVALKAADSTSPIPPATSDTND